MALPLSTVLRHALPIVLGAIVEAALPAVLRMAARAGREARRYHQCSRIGSLDRSRPW